MSESFSETFANNLRVADVPPGRQYPLTICDPRVESFSKFGAGPNEPKQKKLVLSFQETGKDLVCSPTNSKILADAFGDKLANLLGKRIMIDTYQTNMGPALRVSIPPQPAQDRVGDPFANQPQQRTSALVDPPPAGNSAATPSANNSPPARDADFNDPIPF
jgi:hypothetical protein